MFKYRYEHVSYCNVWYTHHRSLNRNFFYLKGQTHSCALLFIILYSIYAFRDSCISIFLKYNFVMKGELLGCCDTRIEKIYGWWLLLGFYAIRMGRYYNYGSNFFDVVNTYFRIPSIVWYFYDTFCRRAMWTFQSIFTCSLV